MEKNTVKTARDNRDRTQRNGTPGRAATRLCHRGIRIKPATAWVAGSLIRQRASPSTRIRIVLRDICISILHLF
jgi:hypothetical protein